MKGFDKEIHRKRNLKIYLFNFVDLSSVILNNRDTASIMNLVKRIKTIQRKKPKLLIKKTFIDP